MLEELYKDLENIINGTEIRKNEPSERPVSRVYVSANINTPKTILNMPVARSNVSKFFEISKDKENLIIDGKKFKIPNWYNREMIALRDDKTLQMILIHHGFNYMDFFNTP